MKPFLFVLIISALVIVVHGSEVLSQMPGHSDPPRLGMETFKLRRQVLMDSLGEGTAVLYSNGRHTDSGYRAGDDFWYLTGLDEPGAILVLAPGEVDAEVILLEPRDIEEERWTGLRPSLTESLQVAWGVDRVRRTNRLNGMMVSNMKHSPVLHLISGLVSPGADIPKDMELYGDVRARIPEVSLKNSSRLIETMRMVKTDAEIAAIEKAIAVTHRGITDLLAAVEPGVGEFQLDGILEESFKRQGAQHMAFPPIVGSGKQTTILHYERRNLPVQAGQLLLLDISRTIPVDGTFTEEQARIYDIVFEAQNEAIAAVKPGVTVREVHEVARDVIRKAGYIDDFIHGTSHHLGLNVHDAADYGMPLREGMVITVEPGIYLPDVDIGVRIEDDVLVTGTGHRLLSSGIPRSRAAVETWVQEARN
jgi:Xaa-Pro aminopeptidase